MAVLRGDVVIPELFNPYLIEQVTTRDAFLTSGVVMPMEALDLTGDGGDFRHVPFWKADLDGDFEVMTQSTQLTPAKIEADQHIAVVLHRGRAYEARDLASMAAGSDAMAAIAQKIAAFVAHQRQKDLLACLAGVFGATNSTASTDAFADLRVGSTAYDSMSPRVVVDAQNKLGDHGDKLTTMVVHSSVYYDLMERKALDRVYDDKGQRDSAASAGQTSGAFTSSIGVPYFMGKRVIVSDDVQTRGSGASKEYAAYFFTQGAVASGVQMGFRLETARDIMAKSDAMSFDLHYIYHPMGASWKSTTVNPTRAQLETVGNWERKYEVKNIGIVRATTKSVLDS